MKTKLMYESTETKWHSVWIDGDFVGTLIVGNKHNRFCANTIKKLKEDKKLYCMYTY